MDSQIWTKVEEKVANILMLRGNEVYRLRVTGMSLTLKRKVQGVLEALEQGKDPSDAGAKVLETLDARSIAKAEVNPGNSALTLHGEGEPGKKLSFSTGDSNANAILQAILERSGRTYQTAEEEIGVVEALMPPAVLGLFAGILWGLVYYSATELAAGKVVEAKGRRRGMQQLLIWVAELLGTGGTIAVGVVLLLLIVGWAANVAIHRPKRTVWLPA